jgi:EpsD family peptidyl-prolyl cis-trans isomerase
MSFTITRKPCAARGLLPILALASALMLAGCGDKKDKAASQTAAKVNKDEITIHQINFMLQQQRGLRPEQTEAAGRQILERLIDQQLMLQKGDELKLDRDPRVVQQLEAARREILARAYVDRVGDAAAKPTAEEIKKYYDEKPALFRERRVYNIQEIAIEAKPEQYGDLREKLTSSKDISAFIEFLKSQDIRFQANQAVRAAEQLPLTSLESFAKMKDGQAMMVPTPSGLQVVLLAGSRSQPVSEDQAKPAIETFLLNERKRKLVEEDIKATRAAAKIEYIGKFVATPASAASAAGASSAPAASLPAATTAPAETAASSVLNSNDISKGMGLK